MERYGLIMAGGGGTRFWPLSRQRRPKQLLNLTGRDLMINETFDRMARVIDPEHIYIVTSALQADALLAACGGRIRRERILTEPEGRNTAACIGYGAAYLQALHGDCVMLITPSDHYIRDTGSLCAVWETALKCAQDSDRLLTIGIQPTWPATGYGYIRYDTESADPVRTVYEFREKPDAATAGRYLDSGGYAWNSGMFVWRSAVILAQLARHAPDIARGLAEIRSAVGTPAETETLRRVYPSLRAISVDYAVMEPAAAAGDVMLVPGCFGWNDVGSWDMMPVLHAPDGEGNVLLGDVAAQDSRNCVVYASGRTVALLGVEGLAVVETPDAVLVCARDRAQEVRKIVDRLAAEGRSALL